MSEYLKDLDALEEINDALEENSARKAAIDMWKKGIAETADNLHDDAEDDDNVDYPTLLEEIGKIENELVKFLDTIKA